MKKEEALGLAHPSATITCLADTYIAKSNEYRFSKSDRPALVLLPLIKQMNEISGLDSILMSTHLHAKTSLFHSEHHQFEGPHANLSAEKMNECMKFPGDSEAVADIAIGWLKEVCENEEDFLELYTLAIAFMISKHVHTQAQSPYILVSLL